MRLFLTPHDFRRPRVARDFVAVVVVRERILLLEPDDRDIVDLVLATIGEELVVHLARADEHALHFFRIELVGVADHRLKRRIGELFERRHRFLVPQQALRAHHDQRLADANVERLRGAGIVSAVGGQTVVFQRDGDLDRAVSIRRDLEGQVAVG